MLQRMRERVERGKRGDRDHCRTVSSDNEVTERTITAYSQNPVQQLVTHVTAANPLNG